ncbi:phosphotransferase [Paenibacillus sp. LMG 31456]|uniref:Phosphotransferase n=1 Tax=Paenibacillus foliorum TaxID=2654974 RepID=A0A972GMW1_9BACL|nr:aminoglycoside phosphotransferase family protein [Paenibacillus foliorum]NOU93634.1 phosphotransferase [Paenibacillus foliorum]
MDEKIQELLLEIKHKVDFDRAELLNKGHSTAKKYTLYQADKPVYLLRVYELTSYARRLEEYKYLRQHFNNGVSCQSPIYIDASDSLELCYLLLTYIDGDSGEEVLPCLSIQSQYQQGLAAGKELRMIHKVVPDLPFNWAEKRYNKYIQKKIKVKINNTTFYRQPYMESFIENNINLLNESSICFQHDDFHPSNLIFKDNKLNGIIDFSRFDWGDPWEEFFKLPKYTCNISKSFANGQIQGYFKGKIPNDFWMKYNLFVALNQHATLIGGYENNKIAEALNKIELTITTHDFSNGGPPKWFLESENISP